MKIAIMQPYIFPYIGYFQLISAVDKFIFYDDVNWIKKGWINRNNYLLDDEKKLFAIPCIKASQNRLINEVLVDTSSKELKNFLSKLHHAYSKAPFYNKTIDIVHKTIKRLDSNHYMSALAIESIKQTCEYLEISCEFELSSEKYLDSKGVEKANRLIEISRLNGADSYINPIGGKDLYKKKYFKEKGVELLFIQPKEIVYKQFSDNFTPWLSIIDVLMFNSKEETIKLIESYNLK